MKDMAVKENLQHEFDNRDRQCCYARARALTCGGEVEDEGEDDNPDTVPHDVCAPELEVKRRQN